MKLIDLYTDINDFSGYVPGVVAGITFKDFSSKFPMALKHTSDLLSAPIVEALAKAEKDSAEGFALRSAIANKLMLSTITFQTVNRRAAGAQDVYKYEVEQMRREYIDAYFSAIDTLFEIASTSENYQDIWASSRYAKILQSIAIKSCQDFDDLYPIDRSFLFYFRTLPFQRELLLDQQGLYNKLAELEAAEPDTIDYPQLTMQLQLATAKLVVAMAIERFDIIELPKTMRNYFDEQKVGRSGQSEFAEKSRLAKSLRSEAESSLTAVATALEPSRHATAGYISAKEEDKIVFMP